jgi:succinate dehydrogenase flavin-adding protein (antitoxin of CptAB toxin-antitoxin module)
MREIDLLLREFSKEHLSNLDIKNIELLDLILDRDDQSLYDYIFKNISLGNSEQEKFIDTYLKKFTKQGNF